jgi:hypothetical protein
MLLKDCSRCVSNMTHCLQRLRQLELNVKLSLHLSSVKLNNLSPQLQSSRNLPSLQLHPLLFLNLPLNKL